MTAVEWLFQELDNYYQMKSNVIKKEILKQAKEIEKQQQGYSEEDVKTAFLDGWQLRDGNLPFPKAKNKWFNEFKNKLINGNQL
jgi:hypothetical protein